jgi:hypothetical protein
MYLLRCRGTIFGSLLGRISVKIVREYSVLRITDRVITLRLGLLFPLLLVLAFTDVAHGASAAFDLSGPRIAVKVTRAGKTLPISEVPNLQPGDRLWLFPELPPAQSVHYLLVAAFLRGPTNPPPDKWFIKAQTWDKHIRAEGIVITVPKEAQQALLFLAPETGGDFSSLRSAVQGKPGAFVRAAQDLNQASLDRQRLEKYLEEVRETSQADPTVLHDRSVLLARSLSIKLDQSCFYKPSEQQIPCLTQNTDQLVLDDEHSETMVSTLTSGAASDLIGHVTSTPMARGGYYSPYVGVVVDLAQLMSGFHTADYQYIPALALPQHDELNLKLNNPPSFHKPKSVLVIGLPAVQATPLPVLRPVDPELVSCLQKPPLLLPAEGAPLVFASSYAHDLVLHIADKSGAKSHGIDLPVEADAAGGGFLIDTSSLSSAGPLDSELTGTLHGHWGFESFTGPSFHLRSAHPVKWAIASQEQNSLIAGREGLLHLRADAAVCADDVILTGPRGKVFTTHWKLLNPGELEVQLSLKDAAPGPLTLAVNQDGLTTPDEVPLHAYAEEAHLDRFALNTGDRSGILEGNKLVQVASLELKNVHFVPAGIQYSEQREELRLEATDAQAAAALHPDEKLTAQVTLKDGRVLQTPTTVEPPRPKVTLISKSVQQGQDPGAAVIRLASADDLPQGARLSFFLKAQTPETFPRNEKIEVAALDDSFHVLLSVKDRKLILQDSQTVLAVLDPLKDFGPSAFGPLRFRPVDENGTAGDWQPLINLVRVPSLKEVRCPDSPDKPCTLNGTDLFLIDSVDASAKFIHPVPVPIGFADSSLTVPRPSGVLLYIRLRDDPTSVNPVALPVLPE